MYGLGEERGLYRGEVSRAGRLVGAEGLFGVELGLKTEGDTVLGKYLPGPRLGLTWQLQATGSLKLSI